MTIKPRKSGHANVNGFELYHEVYGTENHSSCCTAG